MMQKSYLNASLYFREGIHYRHDTL